MKNLLLLLTVLTIGIGPVLANSFHLNGDLATNPPTNGGGGDTGGDDDGDFGDGSDEFEFEKFSNENVLQMIENDMEFACDRMGMCTIHSVTSNDQRFTTSFNFGQGNPNSNLGGASTVIVNGQDSALQDPLQPYWGVKLEYTRGQCTQTVNVPRSIYISMNRYMYDLMDEEGNTRRGFDPAKEAMIMFYSTIMKQASGCVAGN